MDVEENIQTLSFAIKIWITQWIDFCMISVKGHIHYAWSVQCLEAVALLWLWCQLCARSCHDHSCVWLRSQRLHLVFSSLFKRAELCALHCCSLKFLVNFIVLHWTINKLHYCSEDIFENFNIFLCLHKLFLLNIIKKTLKIIRIFFTLLNIFIN